MGWTRRGEAKRPNVQKKFLHMHRFFFMGQGLCVQPHPKRVGASPQIMRCKVSPTTDDFPGKKKKTSSKLMWEIRCPRSYLYGSGLVEFLLGSHMVHKQLGEQRQLYPKESRAASDPLPGLSLPSWSSISCNLLSSRFFSKCYPGQISTLRNILGSQFLQNW